MKQPKTTDLSDETWMRFALREAQKAAKKGEVPVGAVAVLKDRIVARAHNLREIKQDPLGHAELLLLSKIAKKLKSWRLSDVTVYVTLEPCLMCMGALLQTRIARLIWGSKDPKAGAAGSLYNLANDLRLPYRLSVTQNVLQEECSAILSDFFKKLRRLKKQKRQESS